MNRLSLIASSLWVTFAAAATNFDQCYEYIKQALAKDNTSIPEWALWQVPLQGYHESNAQQPFTLTLDGCNAYCGAPPQYNDVIGAFQILTTWVLPAVALMSQFPYESLSYRKRRNLEAFGNWIGAPAAALTTTFWNIIIIHQCATKHLQFLNSDARDPIKNALYILSCINQYEYPRRHGWEEQDRRRDTALMRGVLYHYVKPNDPLFTPVRWEKLDNLNEHLAFQLRLQRRKGVYPFYISILWFGMSFAFSIVISFAALGDNSTAHSLALGLMLSWVPVIVFASVVDRNPTSATRCSDLIERWLFNVDRLFGQQPQPLPNHWRGRRTGDPQRIDADDVEDFHIGEFLGQGRRLRYCGVADTVLSRISNPKRAVLDLPDLQSDPAEHDTFRRNLVTRPWGWVGTWLAAQAIVSIGFTMAFMVSFNTPTVGLGCRSLAYLVWWVCTPPSWVVLGIWQEPGRRIRGAMFAPNFLAVAALLAIMMLQTLGGLNSCLCKSSVFGGGAYGGYMDFENGEFYRRHYDVSAYWGSATGVGGSSLVLAIFWLAWKWHKLSGLWKVTEDTSMRLRDDVPLDWLT